MTKFLRCQEEQCGLHAQVLLGGAHPNSTSVLLLYVNAISRWISFWCAGRCFCYVCSKSGNCMEVRTPTEHLLRTQKQICYTVTSIWWSRGGTGKFALPYTLNSETWGAPGCREARFAYMGCWEVRTPMHPSTPLLIRYQSRKFFSVLEFWGCAWDNVIYEQKLKQKRLDKMADILQMTYAFKCVLLKYKIWIVIQISPKVFSQRFKVMPSFINRIILRTEHATDHYLNHWKPYTILSYGDLMLRRLKTT